MPTTQKLKLLGIREIAYHVQVSPARAHKLSKMVDFPAPLARLACGPIWDERDVAAWFKNRWGTW